MSYSSYCSFTKNKCWEEGGEQETAAEILGVIKKPKGHCTSHLCLVYTLLPWKILLTAWIRYNFQTTSTILFLIFSNTSDRSCNDCISKWLPDTRPKTLQNWKNCDRVGFQASLLIYMSRSTTWGMKCVAYANNFPQVSTADWKPKSVRRANTICAVRINISLYQRDSEHTLKPKSLQSKSIIIHIVIALHPTTDTTLSLHCPWHYNTE